jgi:hypothetical protein
MRKSMLRALAVGALAVGFLSVAYAESPDELRTRLLRDTKFNMVMAESLPAPAGQYKGDGDPTTLEVVILSKKSDGPSRVTEDGEVIFLYEASDRLQQELIQKAFEIRIARSSSGS